MEIKFDEFELHGVSLNNICFKVLEHLKKNNALEALNIYSDELLGKISYKLINNLIEISFENIPEKNRNI